MYILRKSNFFLHKHVNNESLDSIVLLTMQTAEAFGDCPKFTIMRSDWMNNCLHHIFIFYFSEIRYGPSNTPTCVYGAIALWLYPYGPSNTRSCVWRAIVFFRNTLWRYGPHDTYHEGHKIFLIWKWRILYYQGHKNFFLYFTVLWGP